ncbi:probable E3 ubiquitin- ligase RHB1A [Olea europaea subsp. europaea]|uniref:RING-type E3 ubiquitin transferase n=1 Tax=Olea europaea subsp. europaea TaxID=158383 RepID=A0A8S0PZP2_OLEEU|nr:probable E3 ubiquitin- ligase RHB1A [Olea europaea subsp. europaea]
MGGCCCCCASKTAEYNSSPFYQNPRALEEREPLSSRHIAVSARSTGLLVDTNLDTSVPDTYRPPPAPIPYETLVGCPPAPSGNQEDPGHKVDVVRQATPPESIDTNSVSTLETKVKNLASDEKAQINKELDITKDVEDEKSYILKKSSEVAVSPLQDEEDVCPTCLEEYDSENPKIITKCDHHFHLACILEWMERSDTCPVCDQVCYELNLLLINI